MAELMHARLPDSRLVVIPKAAHIANIEQEARFNQALLDFYRTLE
jgi:pimeloyl-ACP methyl ester carboxylesterase